MKRLFSFVLVFTLLFTMFGMTNVSAAGEDVFMLYDGEHDAGNGAQEPWGQLAGYDEMYFVEGTRGYGVQSFFNGVYFFQNTATYLELPEGQGVDLSDYDYIEFDMMSYYDMVGHLELSLVRNMAAHHGSDLEWYDMYFPAETFVHVKMPLKDFITRDMDNRDLWDTQEPFNTNDTAHFSGYSIDHVERIRFQLTYCKTLDGQDCDDIYIVFDNVTATKNGKTHTHGNYQEQVDEIQTYEEYLITDGSKKVNFQINNLPNVEDVTLNDESAVAAARSVYDALPDGGKALVVAANYEKLVALEGKIAELKAGIQAVVEQIEALTKEDTEGIAAARAAYDALRDDQKPRVNNIYKLQELEETLDLDYGNVDGEGDPNAADALVVLKSVVGKYKLSDSQNTLADVDGNGVVNAADALLILQYTVGKIKVFPVQEA